MNHRFLCQCAYLVSGHIVDHHIVHNRIVVRHILPVVSHSFGHNYNCIDNSYLLHHSNLLVDGTLEYRSFLDNILACPPVDNVGLDSTDRDHRLAG